MTHFTLDALESHLSYAQAELDKATAERVRLSDIENQWLTEVESVKKLISVYQSRAGTANGVAPRVPANDQPVKSKTPPSTEANANGSVIEWIAQVVTASKDRG